MNANDLKAKLLVTRMMSFALAAGPVLFLIVVLLAKRGSPAGGGPMPMILTGMVSLIWLGGALAGPFMYRQMVSPEKLALRLAGKDEAGALNTVFAAVQVASLMRWALLEGPALFAVMSLFMNHGSLQAQPLLWVNPALALVSSAGILLTAPTEQTVRDLLHQAQQTLVRR